MKLYQDSVIEGSNTILNITNFFIINEISKRLRTVVNHCIIMASFTLWDSCHKQW